MQENSLFASLHGTRVKVLAPHLLSEEEMFGTEVSGDNLLPSCEVFTPLPPNTD